MPSLPRIRRSTRPRPGADDVVRATQVVELSAGGLTWVNAVAPQLETAQLLAGRFGWHPLDVEDVVSKRQRPKVDDYEDEGYLFAVLHFPVYDKTVQRLNAAELDVVVRERCSGIAATGEYLADDDVRRGAASSGRGKRTRGDENRDQGEDEGSRHVGLQSEGTVTTS